MTTAPIPTCTPEVPQMSHPTQRFISGYGINVHEARGQIDEELAKLPSGWKVVTFELSASSGPYCVQASIVALCEKVDEAPAQPGPSREDWLEPLGSNRRRA